MTLETVLGLYNYWVCVILMMIGFYIVIARGNLIKKIIGLNIFQTAVFLLYITMGKIEGGTAPIVAQGAHPEPLIYSNPLPSVLILTAIVVGVATIAVGLALVVRIKRAYGTIEEDEILAADTADDRAEDALWRDRAARAAAGEAHSPVEEYAFDCPAASHGGQHASHGGQHG